MKSYNNFRYAIRAVAVVAMTGLLAMTGCTKVDDTLGSNLVPDNQQMKAGFRSLDKKLAKGKLFFDTRLYQTDSIVSSNITYGYFGAMKNDTLGLRTAGFLTQYTSYYKVDKDYFGFRPIFDSAQLMLSIESYSGDTLEAQTFNVYEIIDNKYLTEKPLTPGKTERDSIFFFNFDPEAEGIVSSEALFTFTLPNTKGPASTSVTMTPTNAGRDFVKRLMLEKGTYKGNYSIYATDSIEYWVKEFKGLYIRPAQTAVEKGAIYATKLEASGLSIYGRNRVESDPTLVKDTIGLVFYFYDKYAKAGNVSVNTVKHDYTQATSPLRIDLEDAVETNENRPTNRHVIVEGMGGVVTEITFNEDFFKEIETILEEEKQKPDGHEYSTLAINQARLKFYFPQSNYDWQQITNIADLTRYMDTSMARLGLYLNYKTLTGIVDYYYIYEKMYSKELAYGGYINRSQGCYVMNISAYIQGLWNSYLEEKKAATAASREINMDNVAGRIIYLAPEAYSLFASSSSVLQGMDDTGNNAPMKIDLTYTMIK